MVGTLAYKKFKLEQWFPNISHSHTPECCISRKKKNTWWPSDQRYKQTARKRQTMRPPIDTVLKSEKLTHFAGAKDIRGTM